MQSNSRFGLTQILTILSIPLVVMAMYLVFIWSPVEKTMGPVQKIFYFHVGSAWNAFLAFFVVCVCSILFLKTRNRKYDIIAGISAELGVLFTTIVLITGPIWGRSAWNTWWSWEPRLTTTLILWFIYIAYVMIRKMDGTWEKKARLASVFGIVGFIDVPIVYMSIRWWQTKFHPVVFGEGVNQSGGGVEPEMLFTLMFCLCTLTVVYVVLMNKGIAIEKMRLQLAKSKEESQERLIS
ncbi:cytochrome c biogenesis protein [Brevibacillus sp. SYSU BS000544]|uniref:cytochrome c biogenesis protein n=1 Tax=Brevibacillus sp. SYSU BS000544 TaxID=3416443 RepID=UPI003CE4ABC5